MLSIIVDLYTTTHHACMRRRNNKGSFDDDALLSDKTRDKRPIELGAYLDTSAAAEYARLSLCM